MTGERACQLHGTRIGCRIRGVLRVLLGDVPRSGLAPERTAPIIGTRATTVANAAEPRRQRIRLRMEHPYWKRSE